ncbi:MAG: Archaeal ATPase [Lachnospiraceae bacterium]|nr:Archaeal ATPase [Lachnospiraceae bacterium]
MEHLDFCSITTILIDYCNNEAMGSRHDFVEKLFHACVYGETEDYIIFDDSQVCRWLKGTTNLNPDLIRYYLGSEEHRVSLKHDIESLIISILYDKEMAMIKLRELLINDRSVSTSQKENLLKSYGTETDSQMAEFVSSLVLFAMTRKFSRRDADRNLITPAEFLPAPSGILHEHSIPKACSYFCGRDNELEGLRKALLSKGRIFMYGIAGIGKSELAKAYAWKYRNEYADILYIQYSGSLADDIADLDFIDDLPGDTMEERLKKHNRHLRILTDSTLIIIDNFNTTIDADSFLPVLMKYRCHILFTTRSRFNEYDTYELNEIDDMDAMLGLIRQFYEYMPSEEGILSEIIRIVHFHTFAVELSARLLRTGMLDAGELLWKLKDESIKLSSDDAIGIKKDGTVRKDSYYGHIHTLFSLSALSTELFSMMRYMSLLPFTGIDRRMFARWTGQTDMNVVNSLIELGYIKELAFNRICLQPMMRDIALADTEPSIIKCRTMSDFIQDNILTMHGLDIPYANTLFEIIINVIRFSIKDDIPYYLRFIEDAFVYMGNYRCLKGMNLIIREMDGILEDSCTGTASDRALLYDFKANIKYPYDGKLLEAVGLEKRALSLLPEPSADTALLISNINANYGGLLRIKGDLKSAASYMEKGILILREFHLEHMNEMVVQTCNLAMLLSDLGDTARALGLLERCGKIVRKHNPEPNHDHAMIEEAIGRIYLMKGDIKEARDHWETALEIFRTIWADNPELIEEKEMEIKSDYANTGMYLASSRIKPII